MILFLNVFVTSNSLEVTKYERGLLKSYSRYDIFKYALASYSVINWEEVIIYVELDTEYLSLYDELDKYIRSLFLKVKIYHYRNSTLQEWRKAVKRDLPDDPNQLIWFSCNDDHIFIDSNLIILNQIEKKMKDVLNYYEYVSCTFSHWPECMQELLQANEESFIEKSENYTIGVAKNSGISIQILNKRLIDYWFFNYNYIAEDFRRTDEIIDKIYTVNVWLHKEIVRHFDGYSHNAIDINACPPLAIPDGFFEHKVKLAYGFDENFLGYVNINPMRENFSTVDKNGADLRCLLSEIPMFWNKYIDEIKVNDNVDENKLIAGRNEWMLSVINQFQQTPKKKLIDRLPNVFIKRSQDQMKKYHDSNFKITKLKELGVQIYKTNINRVNVKTSIIILDSNFISANLAVNQIINQIDRREDYEIILVEIALQNFILINLPDADCILRCPYDEPNNRYLKTNIESYSINKNLALNAGALAAHGDNLIFIELNYNNIIFNEKFVEKMKNDERESRTIKVTNINDIVSEAKNLNELNNLPYEHKDKDLIVAVSLSQELFFYMNGFDEDKFFVGSNGGVYEIVNRAKNNNSIIIIKISNLMFNIVFGKPVEILPVNRAMQKIFAPNSEKPKKINELISDIEFF